MRAKSMVLIVIALGCGLVASIAISQVLERGSQSAAAAVETVEIYVATTDIDMNEQLTASSVRVEDWPKSKIPEGAVVKLEDVQNRFAKTRLYEGEPILERKLVDKISGAAITIPPGHRVCSLKVQVETQQSGLLSPGDRVDIVGFFEADNDVPMTGTREILRNVRVFAVNSATEKETSKEGEMLMAKAVSVLVPQEQVSRLMLAAQLGKLSLVLRHPGEVASDESMNETATVETLFGTQSQSADKQTPAATPAAVEPAAATEPAGLLKFLAGLKSAANADQTLSDPLTAPLSANPVWKMTVLTPDGGTQFEWLDARGLPTQGARGLTPNGPSAAPAQEVPPSTRTDIGSSVDAAPAASGTASPPQEEEQGKKGEE
ncbi:MAG: Flp pilus assembly protein CpaB [Planctomycetes bacterium]|nr:Flp pilus assembly protein CpaB [Planctomycetota bacterium]